MRIIKAYLLPTLRGRKYFIARISILLLTYFSTFLTSLGQEYPVVIELFTSQGCSSCPAADRNLTAILEIAKRVNQPVFGLSFHVDYWNRIGWEDPYSNKAFTDRQRSFAQALHLGSLYTPQMIVNGEDEFVGSDQRKSETAIAEAMKQPPAFRIDLQKYSFVDGKLAMDYALNEIPDGEEIHVAVVERTVSNYVPRGENSGRKLEHSNVVRFFSTFPARQSGNIDCEVPPFSGDALVVLYLQGGDMKIVGATARELK